MKLTSKLVTLVLAAFACVMLFSITAFADNDVITVIADGRHINFSVAPIIVDGRVMVPVQPIAEAMGWSYDSNKYAVYLQNHGALEIIPDKMYYTYYKSTISLSGEGPRIRHYDSVGAMDTIHFNYGHYPVKDFEICPSEKQCIVRDEEDAPQIAVKPVIESGELFVAVRDLAEAMYATVEWDSLTHTVTITSGSLPYYDGDGLPDEYREWLLQRALTTYAKYNPQPSVSYADVLSAFEAEIFRLVNEAREQDGLQPYISDPFLDEIAHIRAEELLIKSSHTRPSGEPAKTAYADLPYDYSGENLAISMLVKDGEAAAKVVFHMWMNSPGHKANILDPYSSYMGVGAVQGPENTVYCIQGFMR